MPVRAQDVSFFILTYKSINSPVNHDAGAVAAACIAVLAVAAGTAAVANSVATAAVLLQLLYIHLYSVN
jgi:hypothetical protein